MNVFHIAIDGPSGAGKSTIARKLAQELGFMYMDTGAMYRAFGLKAIRCGVDPQDETAVSALVPDTRIELALDHGEQQVLLDGENVNALIRTPEISLAASAVSKWAAVRRMLVDTQRRICESCDVIMDGRDIGSVVLPNAQVKFFLTASAQARARRRALELWEKGQHVDEQQVLEEMKARDEQDSKRAESPLVCVPDAIVVDSSDMTIEETCDFMRKAVLEKKNA